MTLEVLQKDMIAAMKARDKERKDSISSLVSAVKKVGIDNGCRDNIPEDIVDSVILQTEQICLSSTRQDMMCSTSMRQSFCQRMRSERYSPQSLLM